MHGYGQEEPEISLEEQAITEVLGANPRAQELQEMRIALEQRREGTRKDRERTADRAEKTRLQTKINELDRQIAALRQEEGITQFVENSVRVTLHKASGDAFDEE